MAKTCVRGISRISWFVTSIYLVLIFLINIHAQPQTVLILDDFSKFPTNALGGEVGAFGANGGVGISEIITEDSAFDGKGKTLSFRYDVRATDSSFAFFVSKFDNLDLSQYNYMSFWIRGNAGAEFLQVQIKNATEVAKVPVSSYLRGGPTTEWRKVVIPMDAFWNLTSRTNIAELVFVAENFQSRANGSALQGEVYIDDIVCGSFFPGFVRIDHFSDKLKSNDTGANNGEFSQSGDATLYISKIDTQGFYLEPFSLRVDYNNGGASEFGGLFLIFGGEHDGWTPVYKNLTQYDQLHLALRSLSASTNPGNIKVELKSASETHETRLLDIATTWKEYDIPFHDFSPPFSLKEPGQLTIVFERSKQEKLEGTIFLDEIEFREQSYAGPDTTKPEIGQLRINGAVSEQSVYISGPVSIAPVFPSGIDKLESVRLFYRSDTQVDWTCWARSYIQGDNSISWMIGPSDLPANSFIALQAIAQNYNGNESQSEIAYVKTAPYEYNISDLFRNSYELFKILRTSKGVYRDAARIDGNHFHPASVATIGVGLVSLCIADAMGWINEAAQQAEKTLSTVTGQDPTFQPARNARGYYAHFIDTTSGARAWDSEYSSIDTGILMAGAFFCKNYFESNANIARLVDELWESIDWSAAIASPQTGEVYREFNEDGSGIANKTTRPFNEYIIVAWLAMKAEKEVGEATELWNRHYADVDSLPLSDYRGIELLTDVRRSFLSHFTLQFPFYLCGYFTANGKYLAFFDQARKADSLWWQNRTGANIFEWGLGAGSSINALGYHADAIDNNLGNIFSPHIIAGFLPVYPEGRQHLLELFVAGKSVFGLPNRTAKVLWRASLSRPEWRAKEIQGIDFSTMLFGLAALPEHLGIEFFSEYNDIITSVKEPGKPIPTRFALFQNHPNPFNPTTKIRYRLAEATHARLEIVDLLGKRIAILVDEKQRPGEYTVIWNGTNQYGHQVGSGAYFLRLITRESRFIRKLLLLR